MHRRGTGIHRRLYLSHPLRERSNILEGGGWKKMRSFKQKKWNSPGLEEMGGCFGDIRDEPRHQSLETPPRRNLHAQPHMGGMTQRLPLKNNKTCGLPPKKDSQAQLQSLMGCIIIWKRYTTCMEMEDETREQSKFSPMRARDFFALCFDVKTIFSFFHIWILSTSLVGFSTAIPTPSDSSSVEIVHWRGVCWCDFGEESTESKQVRGE